MSFVTAEQIVYEKMDIMDDHDITKLRDWRPRKSDKRQSLTITYAADE